MNWKLHTCLLITMFLPALGAVPAGYNDDESKVPPYTLPDPLICADGTKVTDATTWREKRRPELLKLFEKEVFGRTPVGRPATMKSVLIAEKKDARVGKALRREIDVLFFGKADGPKMRLLLYTPTAATKPVPVILGLNFRGNHTVTNENDISLTESWVPNDESGGITNHKASEAMRGYEKEQWQIDYALDHGYGVATAYYGDIDPDYDDGFKNGVHAVTGVPKDGEWGSIGTWSWGLSRALDILETTPEIDPKKVIALGHSRLGKTALWAGAQDERFALVISKDSGHGGAALSRRTFGETIKRLNTVFPHWFGSGYRKWNDRENECPIDQPELIALIAPRPVLIHSATDDQWADPKGEFLGGLEADPVFRLLGTDGMGVKAWPQPQTPIYSRIGYYLRPGEHGVTLEDWKSYIAFATRQLHIK